jgi:hypothetical protein
MPTPSGPIPEWAILLAIGLAFVAGFFVAGGHFSL